MEIDKYLRQIKAWRLYLIFLKAIIVIFCDLIHYISFPKRFFIDARHLKVLLFIKKTLFNKSDRSTDAPQISHSSQPPVSPVLTIYWNIKYLIDFCRMIEACKDVTVWTSVSSWRMSEWGHVNCQSAAARATDRGSHGWYPPRAFRAGPRCCEE